MKQILLLGLAIFTAFCFNACNKNSVSTNATILGKWNIINDSTFDGVGVGNHPVEYTGQQGDYFDFTTNGILYTKEGSVLDTLSYRLTSNTTIIISSFGLIGNGVAETSQITNLTDHSLTITAPVELTPGGEFGRKVNLSR